MSSNKSIMVKLLIIGVIISLSLSMPLFAQKIDATLRGKIVDTDKQVLPGVKVIATNVETGSEFTAYSSEYGRYLFPALPAAVYDIKAELEGFATHILKDVELKIGQEAIIDITLKLAAVSETIVVTGETPLVEITKSHMGEVISLNTIDSIPLKGRDFTDLMLLLPGASNLNDEGGTEDISFLGERGYTMSYLIDGASNDDDIDGGYVQDFNQDAIQEFEVIPDGYKAEYGRASGGVSNIITKSGTNEFHGRAFLFLRDDAMSWVSHEGQVLPELRRYEYGGTFGGPIKKNKAWYFGSIELVQEDRGITFVPEQYPLAALERFVEGWDLGIVPQDRNYTYFGKINAQLADKHRIVGNFNLNDFNIINQGAVFPGFDYDTNNDSYSFTVRDTYMMSEKSLMEFTFKYLHHTYSIAMDLVERAENGVNHGYVRLRLWPNPGSPYAYVESAIENTRVPREEIDDRSEFIWNMSHYIEDWNGAHDMKLGFDFNRITLSGERGQFKEEGQGCFGAMYWPYDDSSPLSWVNIGYSAAHLQEEAYPYNGVPDDFKLDIKNNQYGFFVQDSWQIKPGFTLNLGARYDYESLFYEDKNNISPRIGFAWDPWKDGKTVIRGSAGIFYDQNLIDALKNDPDLGGTAMGVIASFSYPRLGAGCIGMWSYLTSLFGKDPISMWGSQTGGYDYFGIPYNTNDPASWPVISKDNIQELTGYTPEQFLNIMENMFPFYWSWSALDGWLTCPMTLGSGPTQVFIPIRPFQTSYTTSYSIGIERKLTDDMAVEVRYNFRRISNMLGDRITNLMPDGSGETINNEPIKVQRDYFGWHRIHNVTAAVEKRLSNNFTFLASYAYNWNWTNMPMGIGARPSNNLDVNEEQGPAGRTIKHNFVLSGTYFFPYDIAISGIFRWRSGTVYGPVSVAWDPDGDASGGTPTAEYWPYDNVPNVNCFTLPSFKNVDLRIQKNFKFGRYNVAALVEFFNLFNFDNVISNKSGVIPLGNNQFRLADDYHEAWAWSRGREMQIGFRFDF
jgi:hypothetical protein